MTIRPLFPGQKIVEVAENVQDLSFASYIRDSFCRCPSAPCPHPAPDVLFLEDQNMVMLQYGLPHVITETFSLAFFGGKYVCNVKYFSRYDYDLIDLLALAKFNLNWQKFPKLRADVSVVQLIFLSSCCSWLTFSPCSCF